MLGICVWNGNGAIRSLGEEALKETSFSSQCTTQAACESSGTNMIAMMRSLLD